MRSRSKPGAQRWARFLVPREFADDAQRLPPCSAPDCDLPALADNGSCGQRGHAKAGRPRAPGVYYNLSKTPAAKASKLSLKHAARELGVDRTVLRRRIEAGDVTAERRGRWFLIDSAEVERVRRDFQCKEPGCKRVALGKTGYCGTKGGGHAGAASRVGKPRTPNERDRISAANSAHRAEERERINEKKAAEGLLLIPEIAEDRNRSVSLVRGHWVATGLLPALNHWEGGTHVRFVEPEPYDRFLRSYIFGAPSLRARYRRRRLSPAPLGRPREDELRDELFAMGRALIFDEKLSRHAVRCIGVEDFYWQVAFHHLQANPGARAWRKRNPDRPEDAEHVVDRVRKLVGPELRALLKAGRKKLG